MKSFSADYAEAAKNSSLKGSFWRTLFSCRQMIRIWVVGANMKRAGFAIFLILCATWALFALESGQYRLMSVTEVSKMILISQNPAKPRYLLDASTAKITVDGQPAEFKELSRYSIVNVKWELKKSTKDGIDLDGVASEIRVLTPEQPTKK
jgi:hypothetical protein